MKLTDIQKWPAAQADPPTELETLRAENHLLKTAGIIEVAVRNPNVSEYMHHWERRALSAEAQIAELLDK